MASSCCSSSSSLGLDMEVGSSATVRYSQHFETDSDLKLLEVDESILKELLQSSRYLSPFMIPVGLLLLMSLSRLIIKGDVSEEAVLCTSSATYAMKFVSTSNTMLLIPPAEEQLENADGSAILDVVATAAGHMELVEIGPRTDKLKQIVDARPYSEDNEGEDEQVGGLYSWADLVDSVQASEKQLREELKNLAAIEIGGYWRTVDPKCMQNLLEMIILTSIQQDWSLEALPLENLVCVLESEGYQAQLVRHCVETFGEEVPESTSVWKLDEKRVCLHYAKQLLSTASRWKVDEFVQAWKEIVPAGMKCELEMLRGEALTVKLGPEAWLHPFSASSLPAKPAERFASLFKERSRWEWDDLEPYLKGLRSPGQTVEAMLLKFTRKIQPTAESKPIYTPR